MILSLTVLLLLVVGTAPAFSAGECSPCFPCHGSLENVHGNFNHAADPGSGVVAIFADTDHDDAGHEGTKPYFGIDVTCGNCHNSDLPQVHGGDCATCHPTPYNTLGTWNKGCQQGGCHADIHQDIFPSHYPFEDPYDPENNCSICHSPGWTPTEAACVRCHAAYAPGDISPPVTTVHAMADYVGPAIIGFSLTDNGKVGVGRTFYELDGGPTTAACKNLLVMDDPPGQHTLKYWSKDQSGNTELVPKTVIFNVVEDNTPPTTTSDVRASYIGWNNITLTANDAGTQGVKATYYQLDGGPVQTGTVVSVPTTNGVISHTLIFWSEDWAGNIETQHSANFTTTNGTVTLRLVWGNSDTDGSPCTGDPEAAAKWTVSRPTTSYPYAFTVAVGHAECPGWSGVNDVAVPVGYTYNVSIPWWDSYYGYWDQTDTTATATTPGQVIRISY